MGEFLTSAARIEQLPQKGLYKLLDNELYKDDDVSLNLHLRGFETDNFTWINSSDWDIRCSHGHDVGCKYHQIIKVKLTEAELWAEGFLHYHRGKVVCEDIPVEYLEIVDISGHQINNLFYRMLRDADCPKTPKLTQYSYRIGVAFNIGWFWSGKNKLTHKEITKMREAFFV